MKERILSKKNGLLKDISDLIVSVVCALVSIYIIYSLGYKKIIDSPYNLEHIWKITDLINAGPGFVSLSLCIRGIISSIKNIRDRRRSNDDKESLNNPYDEI